MLLLSEAALVIPGVPVRHPRAVGLDTAVLIFLALTRANRLGQGRARLPLPRDVVRDGDVARALGVDPVHVIAARPRNITHFHSLVLTCRNGRLSERRIGAMVGGRAQLLLVWRVTDATTTSAIRGRIMRLSPAASVTRLNLDFGVRAFQPQNAKILHNLLLLFTFPLRFIKLLIRAGFSVFMARHKAIEFLVLLDELLFALQHIDSILQRLGKPLAFVDLFLVVGLARIHQSVVEQLGDFVQLLIHPRYRLIEECFELLVLALGNLHGSRDLEVQLLDNDS